MNSRKAGILREGTIFASAPVRESGLAFYERPAKAPGRAGAWVPRVEGVLNRTYRSPILPLGAPFNYRF